DPTRLHRHRSPAGEGDLGACLTDWGSEGWWPAATARAGAAGVLGISPVSKPSKQPQQKSVTPRSAAKKCELRRVSPCTARQVWSKRDQFGNGGGTASLRSPRLLSQAGDDGRRRMAISG